MNSLEKVTIEPSGEPLLAQAGSGGKRGRLASVQVLRALAAAMVVVGHLIGHARQHAEVLGPLSVFHYAGGAGVDIFFLISGFIMVQSSGRLFGSLAGAAEFLRRRLIRIAPLYWLATVALLASLQGHGALPGGNAIAASFAFIPYDTTGRGDAMAFPLLDLGWTLNYEMMFYVIFALFLPLQRMAAVLATGFAIAALVFVGGLVQPNSIALHFWTQPIVLEFVAGMAVALAYARSLLAFPAVIRLALVALAIGYYLWDPWGLMEIKTTPNTVLRLAGWGVPAALMLIAAISDPAPKSSRPGSALVLIGDASYALYLLHPFVVSALVKLLCFGMVWAVLGGWGFVCAGLAASIGLAVVAHRLLEVPLTRFLLARSQGIFVRPTIHSV